MKHEFEVTQDGATMGKRYRRIKDPKGNANYSIRPIELTPYNRNIIEQMLALHEPSPYLFTCQGRPLITDTFNKRLKSTRLRLASLICLHINFDSQVHHWQKIRDNVNRIFNTTLAIQIFSKRNIMIHMLQLNTIMVWLQISMIRNIM